MPKQISTIQIRGKHNGQSFYTIKGKQGGWMRNINQAMSGRVKTEPNFENTRGYAAEFGHVQEWLKAFGRHMPISTMRSGKKNMRQMIAHRLITTLHHQGEQQLGHRILPSSGWQKEIVTMVDNVASKEVPFDFMNHFKLEQNYDAEDNLLLVEFSFDLPENLFEEWKKFGADGFQVYFEGISLHSYIYDRETGQTYIGFNPNTGMYQWVVERTHMCFNRHFFINNSVNAGGEYTFNHDDGSLHPDVGYHFDSTESVFFLRLAFLPMKGQRPNAKYFQGKGFAVYIPFGKNINA